MTLDEMKIIISADDSKFNKAINRVKSSIAGIKTSNVGKGFDAATPKVETFERRFVKTLNTIQKSNEKTAKAYRDA